MRKRETPLLLAVLVVVACLLMLVVWKTQTNQKLPKVSNKVIWLSGTQHPANRNSKNRLDTSWNLTCPEEWKYDSQEPAPLDLQKLQEVVQCVDISPQRRYELRGDKWVLYNYVQAAERPRCWESITYATHGDPSFMDNLGPLVRRWRAPVSVALYAPGDDLVVAVASIRWARACIEPELVKRFVTFHVLFESAHMPKRVPSSAEALDGPVINCETDKAPWVDWLASPTYRQRKHLLYPVNSARNVARQASFTHFILASDFELYPSVGLVDDFLRFVSSSPERLAPGRRVFVLPAFEVQKGFQLPETKLQMLQMLMEGRAAPFHEQICPKCHSIPDPQAWLCARPGPLGVSAVGRREGERSRWEPFYIGTHDEPLYDERLSWEGKKDKIVQGYAMCLMDYEFHVLDNAFLVHRPGVKSKTKSKWRKKYFDKTVDLIKTTIAPELVSLYGNKSHCTY